MSAAPARFAAGMAGVTLALFVAMQIGVGFHVLFMAMLGTIAVHGAQATQSINAVLAGLGPALILASALAGAAVTLFVSRAWARPLVKETMFVPPRRQLLLAILAGAAMGAMYLAVAQWLMPAPKGTPIGPLQRIAASGTFGLIAFTIVAVLIAPPTEELLFRGLLLKGFAESWGMKAAAAVVSAVFIMLHIPEVMYYWPALVAIITMTFATLAARLMTGGIIAPIALHAAYNVTMVIVALLTR